MFAKGSVRSRLFVDWKVQGTLVGRAVLYWLVCLTAITLMLFCWQVMTGPVRPSGAHFAELWKHFAPALVASLLLLPLVVVDVVRMSNRFAGPLVRLRGSMRDLAAGRPVKPLRFRRDDFWRDFADEFNAVAAKVQKHEPQTRPKPEEHEELVGV